MKTAKIVVRLDPGEKDEFYSLSKESSKTPSEMMRKLIEDNRKVDPHIQAVVAQLLPAIRQALLELETAGQHHD